MAGIALFWRLLTSGLWDFHFEEIVATERPLTGPALQELSFLSSQVTAARRYYLGAPVRPAREIFVVCGGVERCRPDYVIDRTDLPYWVVEFVVEGEGELTLDCRTHRLLPGVAFAYRPRTPHRIRTSERAPMLKYFVTLLGHSMEQQIQATPLADEGVVRVSAIDEIVEIYEMMYRTARKHTAYSSRLAAALVPALLLKIAETAVPPGSEDSAAFSTYLRMRQLMLERFREFRSLQAVSESGGVNISYLCRLFQRYDHQSAYQLLIRLKMSHAASLLLDQRRPVKEVASQLGYSDPFQFSRLFRKVHGLSPARFQRETHER
jgi:AraC-like DNA-binding protein